MGTALEEMAEAMMGPLRRKQTTQPVANEQTDAPADDESPQQGEPVTP